MSDELAGLRAWMQGMESRVEASELTIRNLKKAVYHLAKKTDVEGRATVLSQSFAYVRDSLE